MKLFVYCLLSVGFLYFMWKTRMKPDPNEPTFSDDVREDMENKGRVW